MKKFLFIIALFNAFISSGTEKTVVANNGAGWSNASNWSPSGVPQSEDVINIPVGKIITVKGDIYTGTPFLILKVDGTIDFDPSGKLDLDNRSYIQLFLGGKIISNGSSSELITIGGQIKYNGNNDGTLTGPKFTSVASPNSIPGTPGAGFEAGVLPIKLLSFDYKLNGKNVELNFKIIQESTDDKYILEKNNGSEWQSLKTFNAFANSQINEYHYTDASLKNGTTQYRLKLINGIRNISYSKTLKVQVANNLTHMIVYPNPSTGRARIQWDNETRPDKIIVYDMLSKVVLQDRLSTQNTYYDINLLNMRNGHYYVTILKENIYIEKTQFIKQ